MPPDMTETTAKVVSPVCIPRLRPPIVRITSLIVKLDERRGQDESAEHMTPPSSPARRPWTRARALSRPKPPDAADLAAERRPSDSPRSDPDGSNPPPFVAVSPRHTTRPAPR